MTILPARGQSHGPRVAPLLIVGALYAVAFCVAYKLLTPHVRVSWQSWADQRWYMLSARAFVAGDLTPSAHWYPLLYPLLVAPLTPLPFWLAFGIVDAACFLIALAGFARVARHFAIGRWPACAIFAATTLLYPKIVDQWLTPWTTTLSAALIWQGIATTLEVMEPRRLPNCAAIRLGLLLALIPLARPADAVVAAMLAAFSLVPLAVRHRRLRSTMAAGTAVALAYAMLHLAIYGPTITPYMLMSREYGLAFSHIGWKAYVILLEPRPWFPDGHGLMQHCPWLIVGAAGLLTTLMRDARRRLAALCLLSIASAYALVMIAYVDLLPSGLWRYNNVNYFKWLLPLFGLFVVIYTRDARRHWRTSATVLAALLMTSAWRIAPVLPTNGASARMVLFARADQNVESIYMAKSAIARSRRPVAKLV